jgi:hypothetical protein
MDDTKIEPPPAPEIEDPAEDPGRHLRETEKRPEDGLLPTRSSDDVLDDHEDEILLID